MKVTILFSDIDPSHELHKTACGFSLEEGYDLMLTMIRNTHDCAMEILGGPKADALNLYTQDGIKVRKANIVSCIKDNKDITLSVRPRRHRHPAAGVFNIKPHAIRSLYGSPKSRTAQSLAAYHSAGSEKELALNGSWKTSPPTYFAYKPSSLTR